MTTTSPDHEGPTPQPIAPSRTGVPAGHAVVRDAADGPDPARAAAQDALRLAELELQLARLRGENDGLRAKCSRLAATVDDLLLRLGAPRASPGPVAGHAPACPLCGSLSVSYRHADRGWRCADCGRLLSRPRARRAERPAAEPTCPYCASADLRRRKHIDPGAWYCHTCGTLLPPPTSVPQFLSPPVSSPSGSCATPRADTPEVCPAHGALPPETPDPAQGGAR